jgi:serine/threonine protein kinase
MLLQVLIQFESYSFPADIWSMGALISFYCNTKHLFNSPAEVLQWSMKSPLPVHYSDPLRDLVAKMLDPLPAGRPTAEEIYDETNKENRQKIEL